MVLRMNLRLLILHFAFLLTLQSSVALDRLNDPAVKQLLEAQRASRDGVIKLTPELFSKYVTGKSRPFALYIFLTAYHLVDNPSMRLGAMRQDFGYMAKALRDRTASGEFSQPGSVFFAESEFQDSQELFQRLGVQMLPFACILQPNVPVDQERIRIKEADKMKPDTMETFPWTVSEFDAFLVERTGISIGKVMRPSFVTSPIFPFVALASLTLGAITAYRLYYLPVMKNLLIWTTGSIAVYWFSVSGGMHNIIRGMPLYALTHQGAQFFMPPGQGQLGAEGFLCGTGYLAVGLAIAGLTYMHHFTGKMDVTKQRYVAYGVMAIGAWSFFKVVGVYRWKTGYRWRTYF